MDILKQAKEEIDTFERQSVATSREMMKEIEHLRFLVTSARQCFIQKETGNV